MPGFSYVAVDQAGKEIKGSIDAENSERVAETLRRDGLLPLSIKEQGVLNKEIDFAIGKKQVHQLHQLIDFHFTKHPVYNWSDERLHVTEQCIRKRAIQLYNIAKEAHKDIKVFTPSLDSSEPRRMAAQLQQAQAQKEAAQESRKPHVIISPPER